MPFPRECYDLETLDLMTCAYSMPRGTKSSLGELARLSTHLDCARSWKSGSSLRSATGSAISSASNSWRLSRLRGPTRRWMARLAVAQIASVEFRRSNAEQPPKGRLLLADGWQRQASGSSSIRLRVRSRGRKALQTSQQPKSQRMWSVYRFFHRWHVRTPVANEARVHCL